MKVHCPDCQGVFGVDGPEIGSEFDCPFCQTRFSFRDKATVVVCRSPETHARFELEAVGPHQVPRTPPAATSPPSTGDAPTRGVPKQPPADYTDLAVGDQVGGYKLEKIIGWGGMSVVFRAQQLSLGRSVALKVLRKDLAKDPEFSQRFLKEARVLADLSHPNIVQVIDQGVHDGNYFLVMEFIDGVSLREVMSERRLSPAEALRLVPALCSALEYAHLRGIVHRDIKPENLMLTREGIPKIADFGLVRIVGRTPDVARLTKTQTIMGTLEYMAPEQREGSRDVDHRADIYSLGVVLYEMLTGELPIARFPLPSERVQVDVRLDEVVLKVLEKDRERRYQSASMIATDLQRLEDTDPRTGAGLDESIGHRVLRMFQSPLVFLVSLCCLGTAIGNAREETILLCLGVAIPLLLVQATLHGLLPRPALRRDLFFYRHPMFVAIALSVFCLALSPVFDEATSLFVGFFMSAGLCAWRWRHRVVRSPGEPKYIVPETVLAAIPGVPASRRNPGHAERGRRPLHALNDRNGHRRAAPRPAGGPTSPVGGVVLVAGSAAASSAKATPQRVDDERTDTADPSRDDGVAGPHIAAAAPTATATAPPTPTRRLSWLVVLGFLVALGTLAYTATLWIGLRWFDWESVLTYASLSYHDVASFFRHEVWSASPAHLNNLPTLILLVAFSPLLVSFLFNLVAVIPLQSPRKRGGRLLLVSWLLLGLQLAGAISLSTSVRDQAKHYHALASVPRHEVEVGDAQMQLVVEGIQTSSRAWDRLALLHRAVELGRLGCPMSAHAQNQFLTIAVDRSLSPVERVVTLVALNELTPDLVFPNDNPWLHDWVERLARTGLAEQNPAVRDAYLAILSRTNSDAPKQLFWEALASGHYQRAPIAVEWWTEYAPMEAVAWLGQKYRELPQTTLVRWLQRLEKSSSARFVSNSSVRAALLGPLLEHPDAEVRHRAAQLIEQER